MKANSKRGLPVLLALVIGIFGFTAFGLAACQEVDEPPVDGPIVLTAPIVELKGNVLSWEPVANATRYIVYEGDEENGTNVNATTYTINKTVAGSWTYTVAAYNAQANPKVGPKSEPVTYTLTQEDLDNPGGPGTGGDDNPGGPGTGGDDDDNKPSLSAPIVDIEGNALNWSPILNAASYDVYKNGEKIDSVESFSVVGMDVLPTTYTITGAVHGDKFEVVAVSGSENVKDSEPSEEVEYAAVATTLSKTASVYVVSSSAAVEVPVSAQESGSLYKVVIKQNNNLALSTGIVGTDSVYVQGSASGDSSPYAADAVYDVDNGVWIARVMVTAENKLYLTITAQLDEVLIGYTVSLEDPYETNGDEEGVVNTYQLGATGSVDVVIPYNVGGFSIKIELEDDVPETGIVIYVVLEDESTSSTIYLTVGNANPTPVPAKSGEGYYVSSAFDLASTVNNAIYLSASSVDLNATVSIEIPDIFYRNIPKLTLTSSLYGEVINQGVSAANMYDLNGVPSGEYTVTVSSVDGINFYGRLGDEGSYTQLSASSGVYTLEIEKTEDKRFFYLYQTSERDGATVNISLFEKGAQSYNLYNNDYLEAVLIGDSLEYATEFKLIDVEPGQYTLTIVAKAYGLAFKVVVGETTYTFDTTEWLSGAYPYSDIIEIDDEESIYIYLEGNSVTVDVGFVEYVPPTIPELSHGAENGQPFSLIRNQNTSFTFTLKDVPAGTYRIALTGFNSAAWEDYLNLTVTIGSNSVQICSNNSGYLGEKEIVIEAGATELVISSNSNPDIRNWVIYLLAEGETLGDDDDEELTSLSVSVEVEPAMYESIDISKLVAGTYKITIANLANMTSGPEYDLCFDLDGDVFYTDNGYPYATGEITIPDGTSLLYIRMTGAIRNASSATLDITLELKADVGTGGTDTTFSTNVTTRYYGWIEIDISSLQYGKYTVTISGEGIEPDFLMNYNSFSISTVDGGGNDETGLNNGNSYTCTNFDITSGYLYLWASDEVNITITLTLVS